MINGKYIHDSSVIIILIVADNTTVHVPLLREIVDELRVTIEPFDIKPTEAPHAKEVGGTTSSVCIIWFFVTILLLDSTCIRRDLDTFYKNVFNKWSKPSRVKKEKPKAEPAAAPPPNMYELLMQPQGPPIVDEKPWPWAQAVWDQGVYK